jgi:hypothetical protein
MLATKELLPAATSISAREREELPDQTKCLRYLHELLWSEEDETMSKVATYSLHAPLLPSPPMSELENEAVHKMLASNLHLFTTITPIKVDALKPLLSSHPNQPFVQSVLKGLHEGFWPWADMHQDSYLLIWDRGERFLREPEYQKFIAEQVAEEVALGHFSPLFGTSLLPGMYTVPLHMVPKPETTKLCMVVDQSAGKYSLNSMIECDDIAGIKLDGIHSLGVSLCQFRSTDPVSPLIIWKSDVSVAYHHLPLHPAFQIKQIVTVDGWHY